MKRLFVALVATTAVVLVIAHPAPSSHRSLLGVRANTASQVPEIVATSGRVIGHEAAWPVNSQVDEYLGIPYAVSPVQELRFMAPKPFQANGTIKADYFLCTLYQF